MRDWSGRFNPRGFYPILNKNIFFRVDPLPLLSGIYFPNIIIIIIITGTWRVGPETGSFQKNAL
jgi:hypothetical protein